MSAGSSATLTAPDPALDGCAIAAPHSSVRRLTVEGMVQVVIMLAIGAAAAAASFTHVHDVAATHGQAGWLAWADAVVLELMSVASGLEMRRRKRSGLSVRSPAFVLVISVALSLSAQVVEAEASPIGWIAAAIPALGFLVMVKVALAHAAVPPAEPLTEAGDAHQTAASGRQENDPAVVAMLPVARIAAAELDGQGRRVSRQALAHSLRAQGYGISNARASGLLGALKAERSAPLPSHARTKTSVTNVSDQEHGAPPTGRFAASIS
jgi:hypothetical protein